MNTCQNMSGGEVWSFNRLGLSLESSPRWLWSSPRVFCDSAEMASDEHDAIESPELQHRWRRSTRRDWFRRRSAGYAWARRHRRRPQFSVSFRGGEWHSNVALPFGSSLPSAAANDIKEMMNESHRISRGWSSPENSLKMVAHWLTTFKCILFWG